MIIKRPDETFLVKPVFASVTSGRSIDIFLSLALFSPFFSFFFFVINAVDIFCSETDNANNPYPSPLSRYVN